MITKFVPGSYFNNQVTGCTVFGGDTGDIKLYGIWAIYPGQAFTFDTGDYAEVITVRGPHAVRFKTQWKERTYGEGPDEFRVGSRESIEVEAQHETEPSFIFVVYALEG